MKNSCLPYSLIFFLLCFSCFAFAQPHVKKKGNLAEKKMDFIENIVLTTNVNQSNSATTSIKEPSIDETPIENIKSDIENVEQIQFKYAQLLDTSVEAIKNSTLYHTIDEWLDTRYKFGGHSKNGIDCSGFSSIIYSSIYNVQLPRTAREQYDICDKVDDKKLKEGDLLFFNTRGGISHVGVYLINGYFVHSSTGEGVMISRLSEKYYRKRFIFGGRITGLDEAISPF